MAEPEKKFEGTNVSSENTQGIDVEVDALIAGAIKELSTQEKKPLEGTHIEVEKKPEPQKAPPPPPPKEEQQYAKTFKEYKSGDIVEGTVVKVDNGGALIDIGYKSDGLIKSDDDISGLKVGEKIKAMIDMLESKEGYVLLSRSKAQAEIQWKNAYDAFRRKKSVEAVVKSAVKGGLLVESDGIRGFIPASQVAKKADEKLEDFSGKTIPVKILQINRKQGKVLFSHRQGASSKSKIDSQKLYEELEIGKVVKGRVSSLKNFGAFVDIGGIEGLIHLSELSWKRIKHPSEVLKAGEEIEVLILGVDKIKKKISLGYKELQPDPWEKATEKYKVGDIIKVKVLRLVKFGAFAELDGELEGLIHISEISAKRFEKIEDVVKSGDMVQVKILRIIPDEQKIGLSMKQAVLEQEKAELENVQKQPEVKVTIGDMIAEKERQKAEQEAEIEEEEPAQEESAEPVEPQAEKKEDEISREAQ